MLTCLYDVVGYALLGSMCLCVYFLAIWSDPCLHILYAWIHVLPCLCVKFLHVYMHVSMPMSLDLFFSHAYVLGSMFSTCLMLSSM